MPFRGTFLALAVLGLVALPAAAGPFVHSGNHFRLTVPDSWTQRTISGADVAFVAPTAFDGFSANVNVVSQADSSVRETDAWLLATLNAGRAQIVQLFPGAVSIQDPRVFTTGSLRRAAEHMMQYVYQSLPLRVRQVLFASDAWDRGYVMTFTAHASDYSNHENVWQLAVDSFSIDAAAPNLLVPIAAITLVLIAVAGGITYTVLRRRRAPQAVLPPTWPVAPQASAPYSIPPPGSPPQAPASPPEGPPPGPPQ